MTDTPETSTLSSDDIMQMTSDIVSSFVSNNPVTTDSLPEVIRSVHKTIPGLSESKAEKAEERPKPAVPISKSVTEDYIVCLEDGKKLKMLKRYLRSRYDLSPDDYRRRWGLPADYPMVAPSYTARRSEFAKQIGLGRGNKKGG